MKYFIDTEFIERSNTIDLVSIGIVSEVGSTFYAVNKDCNLSLASNWVKENVLLKMPEYNAESNTFRALSSDWRNDCLLAKDQIAIDVLSFIGNVTPEFWGYYSDYDWVVFCWLYGSMMHLPKHFPMYCKDLKQEIDRLNVIDLPENNKHNALDDAKWIKRVYDQIHKCKYAYCFVNCEDRVNCDLKRIIP